MIGGHPTYRLDTANNESNQTVITFDAPEGGAVYAVVAAEAGDQRVQDAVAAFH